MKITIRELNKNLCRILEDVVTSKQEIVVTKYGKPYIKINCCNNNSNCCNNSSSNVVTTKPNVVTSGSNVVTKKQVIKDLKAKTQEIIDKPHINYCEPCKSIDNTYIPAIAKRNNKWVCKYHLSTIEV